VKTGIAAGFTTSVTACTGELTRTSRITRQEVDAHHRCARLPASWRSACSHVGWRPAPRLRRVTSRSKSIDVRRPCGDHHPARQPSSRRIRAKPASLSWPTAIMRNREHSNRRRCFEVHDVIRKALDWGPANLEVRRHAPHERTRVRQASNLVEHASTASKNSMPRPTTRSSYQRPASRGSVFGVGLVLKLNGLAHRLRSSV
jgi:hypothetical protein